MTVTSVQRSAGFLAAFLLTAGIVLLQALIGGRGLLFAFPGYVLLGAGAVIALAAASRSPAKPDLACLATTAVFAGYIILRGLASPEYFARADLFTVLGAVVVYAITACVTTTSNGRAAICLALIVFALAHVFVGLVQFSRGDNFMPLSFLQRPDYGDRASGLYACPNHLAGLLEVVAIFGLSLICWSRFRFWIKLVAAYATAACYAGLALTGSRGGYISGFASLLIFGLLSLLVLRAARRGHWVKIGAIGMIAVMAMVGAALLVVMKSSYLTERSRNIIDRENVRVVLWRAAVQQWQLQPILGTGSGTYRFYGREFRSREMQNDPIDVHNDYLHLLSEYGLVGAGAFLLFFGVHARKGWREFDRLRRRPVPMGQPLLSNRVALQIGALAAVASYVVHSAVDFNLHIPANAMLMAFVFGLIASPEVSHSQSARAPTRSRIWRWPVAALGLLLLVQSVRLFPGEYYTENARVALRDEHPEEAITLGEKALQFERANPETHFYLGRAFIARAHRLEDAEQRQASLERAVREFETAHQFAPLDGTSPLNLAFTYDEMGRLGEAEKMYALARARDPHSLAVAELYRAHIHLLKQAGAPGAESL